MKTQTKLMILQATGGLFGWAWIGLGVLAVVLLVGWLFFSWSGWNVVYAFVGSGVAKWLLRGFMDSQRRVEFEAALVEQGYTPEEAGQEWIRRYTETGGN